MSQIYSATFRVGDLPLCQGTDIALCGSFHTTSANAPGGGGGGVLKHMCVKVLALRPNS